MTITATAEPNYSPPRVKVDLSAGVGNVLSAAAVYRVRGGKRTLLRTQPGVGTDVATVYDYECPREVPVTYSWDASYTDPTAYTTLWNETWASTAAWTVEYGTWTVSAGKARSGTGGGQLSRAVTPAAKYRVTVDSLSNPPSVPGAFGVAVAFYEAPAVIAFSVQRRVGGAIYITSNFIDVVTTINPALPIIVDINPTTVRIWNAGGSYTLDRPTTLSKIALVDFSNSVGMLWGAIKVQNYPAPTKITQTSGSVTLAVTDVWLVHPSLVNLSCKVSSSDVDVLTIGDIGSVRNRADVAMHKIMGTGKPVSVASGPRLSDELSLSLSSVTRAEELAIRDLLADQTPILILTPPSALLDFEDDFYQVGDVERARIIQAPGWQYREIDLPLTQVESPSVAVLNTAWTNNLLAAEFATNDALPATFATNNTLSTNTRI